MKTKNKLITTLVFACGFLSACSSGDDSLQADDRVPITLTANMLTVSETRAAADTTLNKNYIEAGQTVMVHVRNTGSSSEWAEYTYTAAANGQLTAPTVPPFYPMDGTNVDIVAFSPSFASSTFTVLADQTTDDSYMASDLIYARATNQSKSTTAIPLQFEHKMAKVVINVSASHGVSQIQTVTLANVYPQVTFNSATGVVGSATGTQTPITLVRNNTSSTVSGVAVIPAQTIVGNLVTVVTDLGTATYSVESKSFAAGSVYTLNIHVGRTAIGATTNIKNWADSGIVNVWPEDDSSRTFTVRDDIGLYTFTMVRVEGGPFTTFGGKNVSGEVSDFYIGQLEVCSGVWWTIMHTRPSLMPSITYDVTYPIMGMTYNDIVGTGGFLEKLNAQLAGQTDGMTFKLPTEIQWEYAARGGKNRENYLYSGGNNINNFVNYRTGTAAGIPRPCASGYANSLGIYDMCGNAWEWCSDHNWTVTDNMVIPKDYAGPTDAAATGRMIRGGGYNIGTTDLAPNGYPFLEVRSRFDWGEIAHEALGFRLVLQ